jgi:PAS domain S-box-containing protein
MTHCEGGRLHSSWLPSAVLKYWEQLPTLRVAGQESAVPYTVKYDQGEFTYSAHALLMALLDKIPVSIYFKDRDRNFVLASRGLYERLGCTSLDQVIGRGDHDFFDELHATKAAADEDKLLDGSVSIINCVEQEVWSDGRTAWVSTVKLPLHDERGDIVGTFGVSMDITEQKQTEKDLRDARDEAQAMGEELEATLEDLVTTQNQLLQAQKLEAIGQLAAGVAHEINTPIQFVSDNTSYIAGGLAPIAESFAAAVRVVEEARGTGAAAEAIEAFDQIRQQGRIDELLEDLPDAATEAQDGARRVAEIVRALKAFAHPGVGTMERVDINEMVESTLVVSRNEWKYVAEMHTELAPDLPRISGNRGQLQQALLILLVNAAQAIGSLGRDTKGDITVGTRTLDSGVEIWVDDTGPGIPEGIVDRVFEPFFTTKDVGVGSGQGLALARGIVVEQHQGNLDFVSTPGIGTRFSVRLPLAPPA